MLTRRPAGGIRRLHLLMALLAVLVSAGACGGSSGSGADTQAAEVPTAGVVATAGGGEFDLAELDDGPAIVWFWAPW